MQGDEFDRGVCANLFRYPAWGLAQETYGEDPVHVGVMGATATRGLRQHVMACVKHYALNSIEDARFMVDVTVDDEALHEVYLPHFRAVIDAGTRWRAWEVACGLPKPSRGPRSAPDDDLKDLGRGIDGHGAHRGHFTRRFLLQSCSDSLYWLC